MGGRGVASVLLVADEQWTLYYVTGTDAESKIFWVLIRHKFVHKSPY